MSCHAINGGEEGGTKDDHPLFQEGWGQPRLREKYLTQKEEEEGKAVKLFLPVAQLQLIKCTVFIITTLSLK